ncbi:MAG: hypothetical protein H7Y28_09475 [Rhodoferax sp.]|nr:hypothetical protein [Rhodoferax sp.]
MTALGLRTTFNALSTCAAAMGLGRKPHGEDAEENKRPTIHNTAPQDAVSQNTGLPVFFYVCTGIPGAYICALD